MANRKWLIANGKWQMANRKWQIANGKWQMANRKWQIANGKSPVDKRFAPCDKRFAMSDRRIKLSIVNRQLNSGFSLIEVLIAVILIGVAIASLVTANIAFTKANSAGTELSTAEFLVEQIRELTVLLPVVDPQTGISTFGPEEAIVAGYDDLDDFDGASFSPPISADRGVLNDFAAFSQQITVENVNAANFEQVVPDHSSDFVRVTVKVFLNSREISSASWIRAGY